MKYLKERSKPIKVEDVTWYTEKDMEDIFNCKMSSIKEMLNVVLKVHRKDLNMLCDICPFKATDGECSLDHDDIVECYINNSVSRKDLTPVEKNLLNVFAQKLSIMRLNCKHKHQDKSICNKCILRNKSKIGIYLCGLYNHS